MTFGHNYDQNFEMVIIWSYFWLQVIFSWIFLQLSLKKNSFGCSLKILKFDLHFSQKKFFLFLLDLMMTLYWSWLAKFSITFSPRFAQLHFLCLQRGFLKLLVCVFLVGLFFDFINKMFAFLLSCLFSLTITHIK